MPHYTDCPRTLSFLSTAVGRCSAQFPDTLSQSQPSTIPHLITPTTRLWQARGTPLSYAGAYSRRHPSSGKPHSYLESHLILVGADNIDRTFNSALCQTSRPLQVVPSTRMLPTPATTMGPATQPSTMAVRILAIDLTTSAMLTIAPSFRQCRTKLAEQHGQPQSQPSLSSQLREPQWC